MTVLLSAATAEDIESEAAVDEQKEVALVATAAEDQPAIMIKLAAPKSIHPYPLTSVLQYLRGKIGKSTANMAIAVWIYTAALCTVRNGGRLLFICV